MESPYPPQHHLAPNKFDDSDQWRTEIEERTRAGETCIQIADALRAKGVDVSDKTISRRRIEWGLRKRATPTTKGTVRPRLQVPRPNRNIAGRTSSSKTSRKEEIVELTQEGKTAEEIATILQDRGVKLSKGASTIWRLQTYWKLIPYDHDRARGKRPHASFKKAKKATSTQPSHAQNPQQQLSVIHYPSNCAFGPAKRTRPNGPINDTVVGDIRPPTAEQQLPDENGFDSDSDVQSLPPNIDDTPIDLQFQSQISAEQAASTLPRANAPGQSQDSWRANIVPRPAVLRGTELMAAELLVDLANSTLCAANNFKNLLLSIQMHAPVHGQIGPPSEEDVLMAKRKVFDAARVIMDLAGDSITSSQI